MRALVVAALLVLHLSAAFAGGDTLLVFDSQGKFVGPLADYGGPGVYLTINSAIVFVPLERVVVSGDGTAQAVYSATQFRWAGSNQAVYASSDCSGMPAITLTVGVRPSLPVRQGTDVTVYIAPTTNSVPIVINSIRAGANFTCAATGAPSTQYGWLADSTYSVTGAYPEPLTIRFPTESASKRWR